MSNWIKKIKKEELIKQRKYSQKYQDALIDFIFANIKKSKKPFCVEFGYNTDNIFKNNNGNCTKLIIDHKWEYRLFDCDNENESINLYKYYLTSKNICNIFKKHNVPSDVDYISIDVDSIDFWLFEALLKEYKAKLFSVEYNCNYPIERAITKIENFNYYEDDRLYGASLKALNLVAEKYGYTLIWVVEELDAFFIRNDLIEKELENFKPNLKQWKSLSNTICHKPISDKEKLRECLDYEVFIKSNGNIEKSIDAAQDVCEKVLLKNRFREYKQYINRQIRDPLLAIKKITKKVSEFSNKNKI